MSAAILVLAPLVVAPAGWTESPANTFVAPGGAGVELVVSHTADQVDAEHAPEIARGRVDELHEIEKRATLTGKVLDEGSQERVDATGKVIEATLSWRDPGAQLAETARLVLAFDGHELAGVTGECIARADAGAQAVAACKAALATLDPGIEPGRRVAIALAATGSLPTPAPAPSAPPPSQMSDGSRAPVPPITIPQDRPGPDRRPVYVGAGIVVLAAVFWWNRRRRAKLEEKTSDDR